MGTRGKRPTLRELREAQKQALKWKVDYGDLQRAYETRGNELRAAKNRLAVLESRDAEVEVMRLQTENETLRGQLRVADDKVRELSSTSLEKLKTAFKGAYTESEARGLMLEHDPITLARLEYLTANNVAFKDAVKAVLG